jgi:hypothetical protein
MVINSAAPKYFFLINPGRYKLVSRKLLLVIIIMAVYSFSCEKDNPAEPEKSAVSISGLTFDQTSLSVQDTIRIECIAEGSGTLHYKWMFTLGNTASETGIIEKENQEGTFDFGKWIKWKPPYAGQWEIEVVAYLSSADHTDIGNGSWHVFYEYGPSGSTRHCFNYSEQGRLWDEYNMMTIVGN